MKIQEQIYNLIVETSTKLPEDITEALKKSINIEDANSLAKESLEIIERNIALSDKNFSPICQDTGSLTFYINYPLGFSTTDIKINAINAIKLATKNGILRPNSVDSLSGKNTGDNCGFGSPTFYFEEHQSKNIEIILMLKGGGCENVSTQYALPTTFKLFENKRADRDLNGVKMAVLDAIFNAQGKGCAPGIVGVTIGSDRASGYTYAKKQLIRKLDDINAIKELEILENEIFDIANKSKIGPMGFGGNTTVLGVKINALNRVPASFFVTISYACWAHRRKGFSISVDGDFIERIL